MDILEKMQQADWINDEKCLAWKAAHPDIENNVNTASADDLSMSIMFCRSYENIFAKEILVRAGKLNDFLSCGTAIEKSKVLSDAGDALGVIIF